MAQDYGMVISEPGVSTSDATGPKQVFNSSRTHLKLDTQNPNALKTILLLITNDPPEPGTSPTRTLLHKYKHGYKYIPTVDSLVYVKTPPPTTSSYQQYFMNWGVFSQMNTVDFAALYITTDADWIYIYCEKYRGLSANPLSGASLQITIRAHVDDIGI